ncbi:MAG: RagB/SusD family nutrient uptake outer membrane protein [Puia sp.]|nr:RagB/SusD family nutrient uptake outer membrane protein [Puia sp.]
MKKYKLFFLSLILFSSCSKSLVENPKSFLSPGEFFQSDAEAIQGVNGAYSTCYFLYGSGTTYDLGYWSSEGAGIATPTGGRSSTFDFLTYTLSTADEGNLDNIWQTLYQGVANCNTVISGVSNNSHISSATQAQVMGQALFLRSLYYYWLTCYWGDVPMWLNALDVSVVGGALPRVAVDTVRQQMIRDLTVAATDLPPVWTGADLGRASKWAAEMLLCKFYLWEKDWTHAKAVAGDIIAQNGGSNHLLPHYGDIWGQANEYNAEDIWEIDFTQNTHQTAFSDRYMPRQVDEPVVPGFTMTGYGLVTATPHFLASFDPNDLREPWYDWHGNGTINTNFHYVFKQMDWGEPRGNSGLNSIVYRMADAYLMYAEAENELNGPTDDAYSKINPIRERAGLADLQGLSQDQLRLAVRNERLWELSFEFQNRWDLNRWGTLVEAVQADSVSNPTGAANVRSYHMLCPVPSQEILLNPALTQNLGYN